MWRSTTPADVRRSRCRQRIGGGGDNATYHEEEPLSFLFFVCFSGGMLSAQGEILFLSPALNVIHGGTALLFEKNSGCVGNIATLDPDSMTKHIMTSATEMDRRSRMSNP